MKINDQLFDLRNNYICKTRDKENIVYIKKLGVSGIFVVNVFLQKLLQIIQFCTNVTNQFDKLVINFIIFDKELNVQFKHFIKYNQYFNTNYYCTQTSHNSYNLLSINLPNKINVNTHTHQKPEESIW